MSKDKSVLKTDEIMYIFIHSYDGVLDHHKFKVVIAEWDNFGSRDSIKIKRRNCHWAINHKLQILRGYYIDKKSKSEISS